MTELHNFPPHMKPGENKPKVTYRSAYEMMDGPGTARPASRPHRYRMNPRPDYYYFDWRTPLGRVWRAFTA